MTRRRLLKLSLLSGLALSGAGLLGRWFRGGYAVPLQVAARLRRLSPKEYLVLRAVARRILDGVAPSGAGPSGSSGDVVMDVVLWIDRYLGNLPAGMQADVVDLLQLLEHSPAAAGVLRAGGRFSGLSPEDQDRVLRGWAGSSLGLCRQGFQALKSMCCLAYYQDPRSFAAIGYPGPMV